MQCILKSKLGFDHFKSIWKHTIPMFCNEIGDLHPIKSKRSTNKDNKAARILESCSFKLSKWISAFEAPKKQECLTKTLVFTTGSLHVYLWTRFSRGGPLPTSYRSRGEMFTPLSSGWTKTLWHLSIFRNLLIAFFTPFITGTGPSCRSSWNGTISDGIRIYEKVFHAIFNWL